MKPRGIIISFLLIASVGLIGCHRLKKTDAEVERENWIAGFSDSIEYYQQRSSQIDIKLKDVNTQISDLLSNFETVKNPREVTGYYLMKGWKSKIPFTTTGIYARINENEKLELIATLAGGTFNQIGVGQGDPEFVSEVTPHDQAFNYRHERFNTVYFSGGKADTIAQYISGHLDNKISLYFMEGKTKKAFVLPENEKDMISWTWELYNSQMEARQLQRELWISSKKIETFRRIQEESGESNPL